MSKTVTIVNQKGGVGKTTSAINLGAYLAKMNKKVLVVDMDPQCNASSGIGATYVESYVDEKGKTVTRKAPTIYDIICDKVSITEKSVARPTLVKNLYIISSSRDLAGLEIELAEHDSRERFLKDRLEKIKGFYDYVLIDCPPSLGVLTINALTASDSIIIPLQCEYYALEGMANLLSTVDIVRKMLNPQLKIEGILLTMYDRRINLNKQVAEDVIAFCSEKKIRVFKSKIPRNVNLAEAPGFSKPILLYADKCSGAKAYHAFAEELVNGK